MDHEPDQAIEKLYALQKKHEMSIIKLSGSIESADPILSPDKHRISDCSNTSLLDASPASLQADLIHYKELFAKLRFSYVEQVTKEKFVRSIVGDPPLIVTPQENAVLEEENIRAKASLKRLKIEMAEMVASLERQGRDLVARYEKIQQQARRLEELPGRIACLERDTARIKQKYPSSQTSNMTLPLSRTLELVQERNTEADQLDQELLQLETQISGRRKEMERLKDELLPFETKRQSNTRAAHEAQSKKEMSVGGVQDELEELGRWWQASERTINLMINNTTP